MNEILTPPRVLITGAGGPSALSVLKAISHLDLDVFVADADHLAAGLFWVAPDRRILLPRGDDPAFASTVLRHCRRHQIDVLVPTVDAELEALAKHRRRFVDAGVRLVLADDEPLARCLDKYRLAEWCREHTCVPETRVFVSHMGASGMTFPLVVKPRRGSGSRGVRIVESPGALARLTPSKDLLLQEYLPGPEYSVDVLLTPFGEVLATVPRERLKVDSGVAVASRTLHSEELQSAARCVVQVLRLSHVVNVQFRRNTRGEMALLEVNARVPGTMPLTVEAGVNMPAFAILQVLGRPLPSKVADFRELGVVRHLVERFVDVDALLPLSERETLPPGVTHGAAE